MDIQEFVGSVRDHYVRQFEEFVAKLATECSQGSAEVKLILEHRTGPFERSYCADFVKNDDEAIVVEMVPDSILTFEPMAGSIGDVEVFFDSMCWDDVTFEHDLEGELDSAVFHWFKVWYDPDDAQKQLGGLSGRVHSLTVRNGLITVDFGTSGPEAFWELFNTLVNCGARTLRISTSRSVQA